MDTPELSESSEPVELQIVERLSETLPAQATLTLPFEVRRKSRLRTRLDNGADVGIFLPHGTVLHDGDRLRTTDGLVVEVRAALETISTGRAADALTLARAAYHLGNRHIPLQLGPGWLRYPHDHVLDGMVRDLGLKMTCEEVSFEPEAGAYSGGHHHAPEEE